MTALFSMKYQIRFTHTDPAGQVFFPRYFEMLQAAVEEWFTCALGRKYSELVFEDRLGTPTAAIQCSFLKPSRLGDELSIAVKLEHVGNSSFRVRFLGSIDNDPRLEAVSTLVFTDLGAGKSRPIPPAIRASMEAYRSACGE